jgi:hypothetical protein
MNSYEMKQQARKERLEKAAERARQASDAAHKRSRDLVAGIPFGQPILVGHHSEKRHRNAVDKSWAALGRATKLSELAANLEERARSVGDGGISSDDPEAIEKLDDKLETMIAKRDRMKLVNKLYRKGDAAGLAALGLDLEQLRAKVAAVGYSWVKAPYESYQLTNLGARIRDAQKRQVRIEAVRAIPSSEETIGLATITVDAEDNRVTIKFPARLKRDDYKKVRGWGFVWSPTRGGFTRKLSAGAVQWARQLAQSITSTEAK